MATVLADLLNENQVVLDLRATARDEALREIVATMTGTDKVRDAEKFLAEVRSREEAHTTYMGNGIAFPHARTNLVERIILGIGRSRAGVQVRRKQRSRATHLSHRGAAANGDRLPGLRRRARSPNE